MQPLNADLLPKLLDDLYGSIEDPIRLARFNQTLLDALRSHVAVLQCIDAPAERAWFPIVAGITARDVETHAELIANENIWVQRVEPFIRPGFVPDLDRFVSLAELKRTRFFNDGMRHLDIYHSTGIVLGTDPSLSALYTINRSNRVGAFSAQELELLRALSPHWLNVFRLQERLNLTEVFANAADNLDARPLWIIDSTCKLHRVNASGEQILVNQAWLVSHQGRLTTAQASKDAAFCANVYAITSGALPQATLQLQALTGATATVHFQQLPRLAGLVTPFQRPLVMLSVELAASDSAVDVATLLRACYGFTRAEIRFAESLHQTMALSHTAAALGISIGNARTTLKSVMAKTQCHSQVALLLLIERLPKAKPPSKAAPR